MSDEIVKDPPILPGRIRAGVEAVRKLQRLGDDLVALGGSRTLTVRVPKATFDLFWSAITGDDRVKSLLLDPEETLSYNKPIHLSTARSETIIVHEVSLGNKE